MEVYTLRSRLNRLEKLCENRHSAANDHRFALEQLLVAAPVLMSQSVLKAVNDLGTPAVSIVMPTYNRASFIADAILSVQQQSFQAWELAVVDDGSTDDTKKIVTGFTEDRRIRYIRQDRRGAANARNRGMAETSAPIVAYLDSDNIWYPNFLGAAVGHLAANPSDDAVYGALVSYVHRLQSRCILWQAFDRDALMKANFIDANVFVHRRHLVSRFGGWDEELKRLSDWDLVLRYTEHKPPRALEVLAAYYRECDGIRITNIEDRDPAEKRIRAKWAKNCEDVRSS